MAKAAPADTRAAIAAAALTLFSESGFDAVSNKELGRVAKVNPALIYYYFKDKDDLFRHVLEKALADALAQYKAAAGEGGADLKAWLSSNIALAGPLSRFVKIILDYALSDRRNKKTDAAVRQFYETEVSLLTRSLAAKKEAGDLALLISVFLDGVMVSRIVRPEIDPTRLVGLLLTALGAAQPPRFSSLSRRSSRPRVPSSRPAGPAGSS